MTLDPIEPLPCSWRKLIVMCAISFAAVALAAPMDARVARWVEESAIHPWTHTLPLIIVKSGGVYYCSTLTAAIAVLVLHRLKIRAAIFVLLGGVLCLMGNLSKWIIGRIRPFKYEPHVDQALPFSLRPFHEGFEGLISQKDLSFPSGHTMVAFATAAALAILWPRWRWVFYSAAALVALERVLENAHWLSDTVGAAGFAICGMHLLWRIIGPWVHAEPLAQLGPRPQPV